MVNTWVIFVIILKVSFEYINIFLNYMIFYLKIIKFYHFLCLMKALCFVSLIYTSVLVTLDFFEYPYVFKLNVNNNINGFDLPPISFCTETNVLFDKNKIISFYNKSQEFQDFKADDLKNAKNEHDTRIEECEVNNDPIWCKFTLEGLNHYLKTNFDKNNIFVNDLSFDDKKYLMIGANQLINCSAKLHSRDDSNEIQTENCIKKFQVLESIFGNQDFGICFTFFYSNDRFYLKDDDYIEFKFSYENGPDFYRNSFFEFDLREYLKILFDENSVIYVLIHQKNKHFVANKQNSIKLSRQGLEGEIKLMKTSVNLLSIPYMELCEDHGKFFINTNLYNI